MERNVLSDGNVSDYGTVGHCAMALQQPHRVQMATNVETMAAENWSYFDFPGELSEQRALQVRLYVPVLLGAGQGELSKECWSRSKLI